jgi:glycosyltransferase involved in cell wall biosynthesis
MNILILNWRDPNNPLSGGAERITLKYASFWVSQGHHVTWIANQFTGSSKTEEIEGVNIKRVGPVLRGSVFESIILYPCYLLNTIINTKKIIQKDQFDIVIDEIHGLPFFTPLYSRKRNILLVCEVAGTIWDRMFPFPINLIGKVIEKLLYFAYINTEIWAISDNTRIDILNINSDLDVKILPLGIEIDKRLIKEFAIQRKYQTPAVVFVARLVKMKGIESAIQTVSLVKEHLKNIKMYIIGSGSPEYIHYLQSIVREKELEANIEFLGHVSEEKKFEIMSQCHFLLHPSYKEGFGLTVLEAAMVGTPSIVRGGSSLDELIEEGKDGFIGYTNAEFAKLFINIYNQPGYPQLVAHAQEKAHRYEWDKILKNSHLITGI